MSEQQKAYLIGLVVGVILIGVFCKMVNAASATYIGERVSGMNRLCFYQSASGEYTLTVPSSESCPYYIEVE